MSSAYDTAVLADSPLAYWPLDDTGTTAADATGNGHTLTLASGVTTGTPSLLPGDTETAMTWGTVTTASTAATPASFAVATPAVEMWLDFTSLPSGNLHFVGVGGGGSGGFGAGYQGGSGWLFTTFAHADTVFSATATTGQVYYVVMQRDASGNLSLYLNGTLQQTITGVSITAFSNAVSVGGMASDGNFYNGVAQKVAIYSTPLSQARITAHWQAAQASTGGGLLLRFVNT